MRRVIPLAVLGTLALVAVLGMLAAAGERASAVDDEPTILLDRVETNSQFGSHVNGTPTSIHIGYGYQQHPEMPKFVNTVFDEYAIMPSAVPQTFLAYVDQSQEAAALAKNAKAEVFPEYHSLGPMYWYEPTVEPHEVRGFSNPALVLHVPVGAAVEHFKMTVPPFTIDETLYPGSAGQFIMTTGSASIAFEAWGTPPPGDANCTASVDSLDALAMLQQSAGLLDTLSCTKAADVNDDGIVDARDVQLVLQYTAGLLGAL